MQHTSRQCNAVSYQQDTPQWCLGSGQGGMSHLKYNSFH